jgi:hypothetical protein
MLMETVARSGVRGVGEYIVYSLSRRQAFWRAQRVARSYMLSRYFVRTSQACRPPHGWPAFF